MTDSSLVDESAQSAELTELERVCHPLSSRAARIRSATETTPPPKGRTLSRRDRVFIFGTVVAALGLPAVLIFGSTYYPGKGQSSVTSKIPDARASVAAVKNLPPPNLLKPISPDEAVKENAGRPFVDRPDTPASRFVLKAADGDRERALTCLTQAIYYEAASEGTDGGRAVAQVIINRLRHPGYPASVCGVVYEGSDRPTGCQFTFACDGSLLRPHVDKLWTRSQKIAKDALAGHVFAPVGHATHYHADYVLPYWADSLDKTVQVGRHIFYRLRGAVGDSRSFFQRYAGFEPPIPAPRPTIIAVPAPTEAEQQQLAKTLIGEDAKGTANDAEKIAIAVSPLLVDAARSELIADGSALPPAIGTKKSKISCPNEDDGKRLTPLAASNLRAGLPNTSC